jgi:hypothetical protein
VPVCASPFAKTPAHPLRRCDTTISGGHSGKLDGILYKAV